MKCIPMSCRTMSFEKAWQWWVRPYTAIGSWGIRRHWWVSAVCKFILSSKTIRNHGDLQNLLDAPDRALLLLFFKVNVYTIKSENLWKRFRERTPQIPCFSTEETGLGWLSLAGSTHHMFLASVSLVKFFPLQSSSAVTQEETNHSRELG